MIHPCDRIEDPKREWTKHYCTNDCNTCGYAKEKACISNQKIIRLQYFKWTADINQKEDPIWIVEAIKKDKVKILHSDIGKPIVVMKINNIGYVYTANVGDYILNINGYIFPMKADIFEKYINTNIVEPIIKG